MAPETAREDAGRLDRRRVAQPVDCDERPDRDPPPPSLPARVVLGIPDNFDDCEDGLPPRRVADGEITLLQARTPG